MVNVSAFSVELNVWTPIEDLIDCLYSPREQNPRKVVGLLGPGSKIRRYTPVYQCPNYGAGYLRGQWWLQAVLFKFLGFCC